MDGDAFFDRLYSRFYIHFPCHALLREDASRLTTEGADDGTAALVLFTDDDTLRRYRDETGVVGVPVPVEDPGQLAKLLRAVPPRVGYVTFDPTRRFHRRYPKAAIRAALREAAVRG